MRKEYLYAAMLTPEQFLDTLLATPQISDIFVSPDAQWVAWTWTGIGSHGDIYIASTDGTVDPLKITDFSQNTFISSWTHDSASLIVKHDYDGDERYRIYKIDIIDKKITPLTEEHPNYFIRGGCLHPNKKYLVYGANYDFENNTPIEPTVMYRHDLETGERRALTSPQKPNYTWPELNNSGTHIIYSRSDKDPSGSQVWLADIEGREDKEILNFGDTAKIHASWFPDGKNILFLAESNTHRKVGVYTVETAHVEWILDDPSLNIEDAYVPDNSEYIVVIETKNARNRVVLLDMHSYSETRIEKPQTIIPIAPLKNGSWVSVCFDSQQPTSIVVYSPDFTEVQHAIVDGFERVRYTPGDLTRAQSYTWLSSDGCTIQGWLYRPKMKSQGTIIYVHGGPTYHSENKVDAAVQFFVSQGFTVLDPNYRGSTGFCLEFQNLIKKDGWGGMEQIDILEGIKSLVKEGIAEPGKIGIMGTSYGGYSSWHAITHFPVEYIRASAPICGMTDLVVDYHTTRPDLRKYSEEMLGGTPEVIPEKYYERSPINFIKNIRGKLLIVQGLQDPNVSHENVVAVEKILQEHNISYETLTFADEGHGIRNPKNKKKLFLKLVAFFHDAFENKN